MYACICIRVLTIAESDFYHLQRYHLNVNIASCVTSNVNITPAR